MKVEKDLISSNAKLVPVDAEKLVRQVDLRLRLDVSEQLNGAVTFYSGLVHLNVSHAGGSQRSSAVLGKEDEGAVRLEGLRQSLETDVAPAVADLGETPPRPATLRGFVGALAIRFLRPLLWWHTRSLRAFASSAVSQSYQELEMLDYLAGELASTRKEVAALREEVRRLQNAVSNGSGSAR
jgi:hypothetical protein